MWAEYFNRLPFVVMHGVLLLLCVVFLIWSFLRLLRERRALAAFKLNLHTDAVNTSDIDSALNGLRFALAKSPDASLIREMKAIVGTTAIGGDFNSSQVVEHLNESVSGYDEMIRFGINGLVIVGLMGTLFAFYHMWKDHGGATVNADFYLRNMSSALVVSFVGLVLALAINFVFSLLKAQRQLFLEHVAGALLPLGALFPTESKTQNLLSSLLDPLKNLVTQITIQNEKVLNSLTDAVNNRTEQLNRLIEDATRNWQATIQLFQTETLSAIGSLQGAAGNLADSSRQVATTMIEVSHGLERTKDIGKIVEQLQSTSEVIIGKTATKLDEATNTWTSSIKTASKEYEQAIQRQTEAMKGSREELRRDVLADFNSIITTATATLDKIKSDSTQASETMRSSLLEGLNALQGKYRENLDQVAGDWMTEYRSTFKQVTESMKAILEEWRATLNDVSSNVQTSLTTARDSMQQTSQSVKNVNDNLLLLENLSTSIADRVGAPVNLTEAVQQLSKTNESLHTLAVDLQRREVFMQLNEALAANSGELRGIRERFTRLDSIDNGNIAVIQALRDVREALIKTAARLDVLMDGQR